MSIECLPVELLEMVLYHLVSENWEANPRHKSLMSLRLVCRTFDFLFSQQFFRVLGRKTCYEARLRIDTAAWLFFTKKTMGVKHQTMPVLQTRITTLAISLWKQHKKEPFENAHYLKGACAALVANMDMNDFWWELNVTTATSPVRCAAILPGWCMGSYLENMKYAGVLSVAAFLGDIPLVQTLLLGGTDPNGGDSHYSYPLYAAACAGQTETMDLLLQAGADPVESRGGMGTPIEAAARLGHLEVVRLLVDRDVDTGLALWDAMTHDRWEVIELLLDRGVADVNASRDAEDGPLLLAIHNHQQYLALRLARTPGLNPNVVDRHHCPALTLAVQEQWADVVEALLARTDIDVNLMEGGGRTPLHIACRFGDEKIVNLFLARDDVNVNTQNNSRRTPLCTALLLWCERNARLLLNRPDLDASLGPDTAHSPLPMAARNHFPDLVELLLQRPEVRAAEDFAEAANEALAGAVRSGHKCIFELVRNACPVDINGTDRIGRPLLHLAIMERRHGILKLLLESEGIHINIRWDGMTPLMKAARYTYLKAMELLLPREDIDANANGQHGTALWISIGRTESNLLMVQMLLQHAAVDPNIAPRQRQMAVPRPVKEYVGSLPPSSSAPDISYSYTLRNYQEVQDIGYPPLVVAIFTNAWECMESLLAHGAINPNAVDSCGRTPLWWAVFHGQEDSFKAGKAVELLLEHEDTDPNIADRYGWTPLILAVFLGCEIPVQMMLDDSRTDANRANEDGWTPLYMAIRCNRSRIQSCLLKHTGGTQGVRLVCR